MRALIFTFQEILILDFNHFYEMGGQHNALIDMILEAFGDKVASYKL
jgi:hypothetical protein